MRRLAALLLIVPFALPAQEHLRRRWGVGLVGTGAVTGELGKLGAGVAVHRLSLRWRAVSLAAEGQAFLLGQHPGHVCVDESGASCPERFPWARVFATLGLSARYTARDPGIYLLAGTALYYPWWYQSQQSAFGRRHPRWEGGPAGPLFWFGYGGLGHTEFIELRMTHLPDLRNHSATLFSLILGARF